MDDFFNEHIAKLDNPLSLIGASNMQPTTSINSTVPVLSQVQATTDQVPSKHVNGIQQQQLLELQNRQTEIEQKQKQLTQKQAENQQYLTNSKTTREKIQTSTSDNNDQQFHEQLKELKHQQALANRKQQELSHQEAELQQNRIQVKIEQLKLQEQLEDLTDLTKEKNRHFEELCEKLERLRAIADQKEQLIVQLQAEINQLNKKQVDGVELIYSNEKDCKLHEHLEKLKHEKEQFLRSEDEKNEYKKEIDLEQVRLQKQLQESTENTRENNQQLNDLMEQLNREQLRLQQKENQIGQLQVDNEKAKCRIELQQKQDEEQSKDFEKKINEKDRQLTELVEQFKQEQTNADDKEKQLLKLRAGNKKQKIEMESERDKTQKNIQDEIENKADPNQLEQLLEKSEHLEQQLKRSEKTGQELQKQLAEIKAQKERREIEQNKAKEQFDYQLQFAKDKEQKLLQKIEQLKQQQKQTEEIEQYLIQLQIQNQKLKDRIEQQQQTLKEQIEERKQLTSEKQIQMELLKEKLEHLQDVQRKADEKLQHLAQLLKIIKTIDYHNLPFELINQYVVNRIHVIEKRLKNVKQLPIINEHEKDYFEHKIPNLVIETHEPNYKMTVTGFSVHHDEFKILLQQILTLYNQAQKAIDYYDQYLKRILKRIALLINKVKANPPQYWKQYSKTFVDLLQNKAKEYLKLFDELMTQKLKRIYIDKCIEDSKQQFKSWLELKEETVNFMKKHPFNEEIEKIKQSALDDFVEQNIYQAQIKTEKTPTDKSKAVLLQFINGVKTTLKNDEEYVGQNLNHFQMLPELLRGIIIHYKCFLIQLPLYDSAEELFKKIEDNTVITISTSTGSGQ